MSTWWAVPNISGRRGVPIARGLAVLHRCPYTEAAHELVSEFGCERGTAERFLRRSQEQGLLDLEVGPDWALLYVSDRARELVLEELGLA